MKRIARKLFDIRDGEGILVSLMFLFIFFLIASFLIVKPVRSSLFLVNLGVKKLPIVFVLVALFSAVVATLYSKLAGVFMSASNEPSIITELKPDWMERRHTAGSEP